jgi:hypothetical protein
MQQCPRCQSASIHRSRSKTAWETLRKEITGKRPFRCRACGWRGWGYESAPKFNEGERLQAERAPAARPPNLTGAPLERQRREVDELELSDLDVLAAPRPVGSSDTD